MSRTQTTTWGLVAGLAHDAAAVTAAFEALAWDLTFDGSWEIDLWGRIRRQVESAGAHLLANLAAYDDVLVTLLGEISSTYVRIRVLEERLALARDNVRVQRESLEIARVRYEAGGTSELDVQQAKTLLADTEASIPELEIRLRQAEHTLAVLLGAPPGDMSEILSGSRGIPAAPPAVAAAIPAVCCAGVPTSVWRSATSRQREPVGTLQQVAIRAVPEDLTGAVVDIDDPAVFEDGQALLDVLCQVAEAFLAFTGNGLILLVLGHLQGEGHIPPGQLVLVLAGALLKLTVQLQEVRLQAAIGIIP